MGHIIPKLSLNKTPQDVESNSLVFAKNVKVNLDGSIGRDNSINEIIANNRAIDLSDITGFGTPSTYLGHIVGVNSCIYLFMQVDTDYRIYEYNEVSKILNVVPCNWTYHGGKITGCVTTNNTNQRILTVSEYDCEELVPLKHINLLECKTSDDESTYTQNPNIPLTNLNFVGYYNATIPNGVYQFFIRYKVRNGFYTNWFPATKELYAGNPKKINTIQGSLKYVDLNEDCGKSFVFDVVHLKPEYNRNYKEFQIGFIVSSNNATVGRSWKSFKLNISRIYFDYNKNFIEEVLVDDFFNVSYDIYNAKNVVSYKNKLYVSNYVESDLNPDLQEYADKVNVYLAVNQMAKINNGNGINKNPLTENTDGYYDKITVDGNFSQIGKVLNNEEIINSTISENSTNNSLHIAFPNAVRTQTIKKIKKCCIYSIFLNCDLGTDEYAIDIFDKSTEVNAALNTLASDGSDYPVIVANTNKLFNDDLKYCDFGDVKNYILGLPEVQSKITHIGHDGLIYVKTQVNNNDVYLKLNQIEFSYFYISNYNEVAVSYNDTGNIAWDSKTYYPNGVDNHISLVKIDSSNCKKCDDGKIFLTPNAITPIETYDVHENIRTLMPFTKYKFYIHYVKDNGIVTNGFEIGEAEWTVPSRYPFLPGIEPFVIYPTFSNIQKPTGYSACFISCVKTENNIATLIDTDTDNNLYDCIELDALLYSSNELLELGRHNSSGQYLKLTDKAKYHGSNTELTNYFGTAGFINAGTVSDTPYFVKFPMTIDTNDVTNLIKITPFILLDTASPVATTYDDNFNLPGFICEVTKLNRTYADKIYVSGFDVFEKNITENNAVLDEINDSIELKVTDYFYIWSNFNLNVLILRENLNKGFRTWNKQTETTDDGSVTKETQEQQWIVSVNSQNCSLIYDLPLMYKEYIRKYYNTIDDKTFTVFDNTVRSSNVDIDEVFRSIYKFDAEDYYNVPTNRGIIVNLFSINNEIFVHTEHGLFKFTDSSLLKVGDNLYSSNKEVGVGESSPFEIGIAEIVDSQYGHGGLQKKEHSLITFNGYIFYDSLVKTIYIYDNQSGIQNITPPVRKVIDWFQPTDITFVSDDYNNRFFITLAKSNQIICLSYSFLSKSFVSIHDIIYTHAFNSRLYTYFINDNKLLKIDYDSYGTYVNKHKSVLYVNDENYQDNINRVSSCIDIIVNDGYETIKALSHVHWICSRILDYITENNINIAEEVKDDYGGNKIRVYTDETYTDLLEISVKQNTQSITNEYNYKYPRYNNGIWTMNYFRDIKNTNNNLISDNMSLIHGKYFVVRFIFNSHNTNFKFENLNINFKNYEKV